MLPRWQHYLVRLLCALLVGAGVPGQRSAGCGAIGEPGPCAVSPSCCCPADDSTANAEAGDRCCDCETPAREPQPTPQPESWKAPLPFAEAPPARAPPRASPHVVPAPLAVAAPRAHGPLPKVARRIAYSVWRL